MKPSSATFVFAGGGTGGHLFPGIAVAEELRRRLPAARMLFVGTERDVERRILIDAGFEHVALSSPPSTWIRRKPLRFVTRYWAARRAAGSLLADRQPIAAIGLGGFASIPVVMAASRLGIPIVLLEQNAVAGRATQWLARRADVVCHSYADAVPDRRLTANAVVTGNPVRRAVAQLATHPNITAVNAHPRAHARDQQTLLVLGGSQGSAAVNDAVLRAAEQLCGEFAGWRIIHQCGPHDRDRLAAGYGRLDIAHEIAPFFADLPQRYALADVVVSRAGATTLAELACTGLPAVLIPYPDSVRDHQRLNAEVFARTGGAVVVEQHRHPDRTGRELTVALRSLLTEPVERAKRSTAMRSLARPPAAAEVAQRILHVAGIMPAAPMPPHFARTAPERVSHFEDSH
ncbi:MAG: undecaprenyldiphospho-muramoylpentapeptide beta-N-acetylglucosaminyltransferase [Planctomycetaceae bacterium]